MWWQSTALVSDAKESRQMQSRVSHMYQGKTYFDFLLIRLIFVKQWETECSKDIIMPRKLCGALKYEASSKLSVQSSADMAITRAHLTFTPKLFARSM